MNHSDFAERVIAFNQILSCPATLPEGFAVLNPFADNPETLTVMAAFYRKFYADHKQRRFIIGINPSRHGAGVTGVPFTDTKRLQSVCGITMHSAHTHEVSSVFMYDMIAAYGGASGFYSRFYINSPFPLAIIRQNSAGKWLNANYYDDAALFSAVRTFMTETLKTHIGFGLDTENVYVLGKKNAEFIRKINEESQLFGQITVLEHPRYIEQYKSKDKQSYIEKYLNALKAA